VPSCDPSSTAHSLVAPLRRRAFAWLVCARLISAAGSAIAPLALAFALLERGHGVGAVGAALGGRALTVLSFLLIAGAIIERFALRGILVSTALVAAVAQSTTCLLLWRGGPLWAVIALQLVGGATAAVFFPAASSALPRTIPKDLLRPANVVLRLGVNLATIGAAATSGALVALLSAQGALAADALSFLLAAVAYTRVRLTGPDSMSTPPRFIPAAVQGFRLAAGQRWLWVCILHASLMNAALAVGVEALGPVLADQRLGGATPWGQIIAVQGAGFLAGGFLAARHHPARPIQSGLAVTLFLAPLFSLLASSTSLAVLLAAAFLAGVGYEVFIIHWNITVQHHLPARDLPHLYAIDALGSNAAVPAAALAGPAHTFLGLSATMHACTALTAVSAVGALLLCKDHQPR